MSYVPYVFLKFVFWQLWPVGCAGCTDLGCFWLGKKFGQQFFSGPRYIVNFQLPAVGRTSKKHTVFRGDSYKLTLMSSFFSNREMETEII
jgi:hypothetical protein